MTIYNEGIIRVQKEHEEDLLRAMIETELIANANTVGISHDNEMTVIELSADSQCLGNIEEKLKKLCKEMKNCKLSLDIDYFGDEEGSYLKDFDGELQSLGQEETILRNASDADLIEELKRRGYSVGGTENVPVSRQKAGMIAKQFMKAKNPDAWDGEGIAPLSFDKGTASFPLIEESVDLSYSHNEKGWYCSCKLMKNGKILRKTRCENLKSGLDLTDAILSLWEKKEDSTEKEKQDHPIYTFHYVYSEILDGFGVIQFCAESRAEADKLFLDYQKDNHFTAQESECHIVYNPDDASEYGSRYWIQCKN